MHHLASTFWNAATWNDGERSHSQLETTKSTNDSLLLGADEREESKRENPLIVNKYTQLAEFQHALNSYGQKVATKLHFASMREINPVRTFVYWVICLCLSVCLFIRPHSIGCGLLLHSCVCLSVGHDREPYNKKLSYRRGTARCVVSIEILPIATQQCWNYLYKSWPNRWYEVGDLVGGNAW